MEGEISHAPYICFTLGHPLNQKEHWPKSKATAAGALG